MIDFKELFKQFSQLKIAIIGDVMLDTYCWGSVERISPEAPVPIVSLHKKEHRIGGAGNVALNTAALGAETVLFSVTGNDADADILIDLMQQQRINTQFIVRSSDRLTTSKTRIMGRNQQMMRIDSEVTSDINEQEQQQLLTNFTTFAKEHKPAAVIFEDYNKGVLTAAIIECIINICKRNNIITTVDPKRKNFFLYKDVDIFKPNIKEVKEALNLVFGNIDETSLNKIHERLYSELHHKISLITLSEKGVYIHDGSNSKIIPSHIRNISDVSGAGDTVIAVASLIYAATNNIMLAAEAANIAGGLVCEEVGTVAINKERLLLECTELLT